MDLDLMPFRCYHGIEQGDVYGKSCHAIPCWIVDDVEVVLFSFRTRHGIWIVVNDEDDIDKFQHNGPYESVETALVGLALLGAKLDTKTK